MVQGFQSISQLSQLIGANSEKPKSVTSQEWADLIWGWISALSRTQDPQDSPLKGRLQRALAQRRASEVALCGVPHGRPNAVNLPLGHGL